MRKNTRSLSASFRTALVTFMGVTGIEAVAHILLKNPFAPYDFLRAVAAAAAAAALAAAGAGALAGKSGGEGNGPDQRTLTLLISSLLISLLLVLHALPFKGPGAPWTGDLLMLAGTLVLFMAAGAWLMGLAAGAGPDRAWSLTFAVAVFAGVYTAASDDVSAPLTESAVVLAAMLPPAIALLRNSLVRSGSFKKAASLLGLAVITLTPAWALVNAGARHLKLAAAATAPAGSPSVILITVDTLREDCSRSGAGLDPGDGFKVPAMEALSSDGVRFRHAMAPSTWTPPSVASMMTGLDPTAAGAGILIPGDPYDYTGLGRGSRTLADVFHEKGYVTAAFVHNAWLTRRRGFAEGFARFEFMEEEKARFLFSRAWASLYDRFFPEPPEPAARLTDRVLKWLGSRPEGPFFLWVHYIDPHLPYMAHAEYPTTVKPGPMGEFLAMDPVAMRVQAGYFNIGERDREFFRQRYEGEVRFTDDEIGRLIRGVKDLGLYDKSVIALAADHGEEFWEHGSFEHGHSFHVEVIQVPLILKLAGNADKGREIASWVGMVRLGATLLDAAGIKEDFPGTSLLACMGDPKCGEPSAAGRVWYSEGTMSGSQLAALGDEAGRKAIISRDGTVACYDLVSDPKEKSPELDESRQWKIGMSSPMDIYKAIREKDLEHFAAMGGRASWSNAPGPDARKLKDLGYLQ